MQVKQLLDQYQSNKFHLEQRKERKMKIEKGIYEVHVPSCTQRISDMPHQPGGVSDQTATTAIKIIDEKEEALKIITNCIESIEQEIRIADCLIGTLKYKDQIIANKRVKERKSWEIIYKDLVEEFGYEKRYSDPECIRQAYIRIEKELQNTYDKGQKI